MSVARMRTVVKCLGGFEMEAFADANDAPIAMVNLMQVRERATIRRICRLICTQRGARNAERCVARAKVRLQCGQAREAAVTAAQ